MKSFLFITTLVLLAFQSWSIETTEIKPTAQFDSDGNLLPENPSSDLVGWESLNNKSGINNQWNSVGQLDGLTSKCTVNLVRPPNCSNSAKLKAQVITNGHCTMKKKTPLEESSIWFKVFQDIPESERLKVSLNKVLYETQSKIDLSIIELDMTYQQLEQMGVKAKNISKNKTSSPLTNVAIPVAGIPTDQQHLRKSTCERGEPVRIVDYSRYWDDQFVANCSVSGGSSGSGLYDSAGEVTALINAGGVNKDFKNGLPDCAVDTCVYDGKNFPKRKMKNYALDVTRLHKCYKNCKLDTDLPGCDLPKQANKERQISLGTYIDNPYWKASPTPIPLSVKGYKNISLKVCSQGDQSCSCDDPEGYTQVFDQDGVREDFAIDTKPYLNQARKPSFHVFCVLGKGKDGQWDKPRESLAIPIYYADSNKKGPPSILNGQ